MLGVGVVVTQPLLWYVSISTVLLRETWSRGADTSIQMPVLFAALWVIKSLVSDTGVLCLLLTSVKQSQSNL